MKRAIVVADGKLPVEAVLEALAASGYETVEVPDVSRARECLASGATAVVLGCVDRGGERGQAGALASLPPALRRACALVLVGPGLVTGAGTKAFILGVDLVVALRDTPRLGELVDSAAAFKRTLVASLDPAVATRVGG